MAKRRSTPAGKPHLFRNRLVLNQWVMSLLGVDPLQDHKINGRTVRPLHALAEPIRDPRMEGLDESNVHRFFHNLITGQMFPLGKIDKLQLLKYEENLVAHTQAINARRTRPIVWKYPQWLTLLFVEIYLDRYFSDRAGLLKDLNDYVDRFNQKWPDYAPVPTYIEDDLNKLCFQNATGSGKTLIMHVNLLQYQHYSKRAGQQNELSRVILLTPNERLSEQHLGEFGASSIASEWFVGGRNTLFTQEARGLKRVDVMEITKLADQDGPNTIATRSLGDQNLLLVDEGHRGMSGKEEGAWVARRNALCSKGFTFEYSATFAEAVAAAKDEKVESTYAKAIIFDYSYRYFYEDGFGKDYQILNLSKSFDQTQTTYLTACLLKFYQQLRVYEERGGEFSPFNLEKPLWVFVGSSVVKATGSEDEKTVASDVAKVLHFVADFLYQPGPAKQRIGQILSGTGQDTGLLDENGSDIFAGSFTYLSRAINAGETAEVLYQDILRRVFNNPAGGMLVLSRIKGDSGEIALKAGAAEQPFGLINVGDAAGLARHCQEVLDGVAQVEDSEFSQAMFAGVKDSSSPVNLLIGSKKFIEGWDCWRVSTMGLMHVGKSEGSQIIQLFGRGVRLKGYQWSLKRSGHTFAPTHPQFIQELETLNIFGIEADFMQRFREFLKEEGLPGNERKAIFTMPLAVTHDFGKKLKILRPKQKASDGREYDFKRDGRAPTIGDVPEYMQHNTIVADWYPRIQAETAPRLRREDVRTKAKGVLGPQHLIMLNYDDLYFELEAFKRERSWYNLNVPKHAIRPLLADPSWYTLYIPPSRLEPTGWDNVRLWQQVAAELLKRYCDHYYNYRKSEFIEPRLELRDLTKADDNLPQDDQYQLIVDGSEEQVIQGIKEIQQELAEKKGDLLQHGDLHACVFGPHVYQPLFHVRRGGKIQVLPVALNESEFQFLQDLKKYCEDQKDAFKAVKRELFLLRNMSRGRGVGFFEARNFHPDFILWVLEGAKQYVTFIEPHGLQYEGPGSPKVLFHERVKDVQQRLGDPNVVLDSFVLSWTKHGQLDWGLTRDQLKAKHVLFMTEDRATYIAEMFAMLLQTCLNPTA